jgi:hypothetical protein
MVKKLQACLEEIKQEISVANVEMTPTKAPSLQKELSASKVFTQKKLI